MFFYELVRDVNKTDVLYEVLKYSEWEDDFGAVFKELDKLDNREEILGYILEKYKDSFIGMYSMYLDYLRSITEFTYTDTQKLLLYKATNFYELEKDTYTPIRYMDVSAYDTKEGCLYAIEFNEPSYWLGLEIMPKCLSAFTDAEIVAHSMMEMCFYSPLDSDKKEFLDSLQESVEDIESGIEEGTYVGMSFEDFMAQLDTEIKSREDKEDTEEVIEESCTSVMRRDIVEHFDLKNISCEMRETPSNRIYHCGLRKASDLEREMSCEEMKRMLGKVGKLKK